MHIPVEHILMEGTMALSIFVCSTATVAMRLPLVLELCGMLLQTFESKLRLLSNLQTMACENRLLPQRYQSYQ